MIRRGDAASFHEPPFLLSLFLSSRDARGMQTLRLPLLRLLQSPLLSCACAHAPDLSLPCASHAEIIVRYYKFK